MTFTLKIIQGRKVTGLEKKTQKVTGSKPVVTGSKPVVTGSKPVVMGSKPVVTGSKPVVVGSKPVVIGSKRVLEWVKNCRIVELLFLKVFVVQLILPKSSKWRLVKKT